MWQRKLPSVAFEIMILRDECSGCGSRECENVDIWTRSQSDIIGMFGIIAFATEEVYQSCGKIFIHEKPPVWRQTISWRHRQLWN